MERTTKGDQLSETYWSLAEYADHASNSADRARRTADGGGKSEWLAVNSFDQAVRLARLGWDEQLDATLALAESAVQTADQEHMMDTFNPVWDVTGAEVDVARYLSGEPECMIDFPLARTSKSGRVITLVVSGVVSGSIEAETIQRRGQVIVALAMALNQLGHACEIWLDMSLKESFARGKASLAYQRIMVKSASDELDPAQIMFALAHPAMLRVIGFGTWDGFPGKWQAAFSEAAARGIPYRRDDAAMAAFPEGTIFLPEIYSDHDIPDADVFLKQYLGELGLLAE